MKVLIFSFYDYYSELENIANTIYNLTSKERVSFFRYKTSEADFFLYYTEKNHEYIDGFEYIRCIYFCTSICCINKIGAPSL